MSGAGVTLSAREALGYVAFGDTRALTRPGVVLRHGSALDAASELVREAILRTKEQAGSPSCRDAFSDVCGIVDGPKDLSTNPKHMRGFGE